MLPLPDGAQAGTNEGVEINNTGPKILTLEDGAYFSESQPEKSNIAPAAQIKVLLNSGVYVAHRLFNWIIFLQGPRERSKSQGGTEILLL